MHEYDAQKPAEGDLLGEKFRVERVLGQGGMGVVLAARHVDTDERVAIKLLLPAASEYPEVVERFAREARAAMRIAGPHVARVREVGALDDGRTFLVMEYLEGCDLREALRLHGALPAGEAALHVLEALEALGEAHANDVVHRDLKPANLFLAEQPDGSVSVKVLDFGISKLKDDGNALTKTFDVIGTPFYMAPEQLTNAKNVDERADIWSIGVILYELVTGKRPFEGRTMTEIIQRILGTTPPPPSSIRTDLPVGLDAVIARCLASELRERYEDVGELADALAPFAGPTGAEHAARVNRARGRDASQRRPRPAPRAATAPDAVVVERPLAPTAKPARAVPPAVVAIVVLVVLALAVWLLGKSR